MGKKKQRKPKDVVQSQLFPSKNQENLQTTANSLLPSKCDLGPFTEVGPPNKLAPPSSKAPSQSYLNGGSNCNSSHFKSTNPSGSLSSQLPPSSSREKASNFAAPACNSQPQNLSKNQFSKETHCDLEQQTSQKYAQVLPQQKGFSNQERNLSSQNHFSDCQPYPVTLTAKQVQQQLPQQFSVPQEMDSSLEEDFNIADDYEYGLEEMDEEGIQLSYPEENTTATGFAGEFYDEVESYEGVINQMNPGKMQEINLQNAKPLSQKKNLFIQNFLNSKYLMRKQFPQIVDIKTDESFQSDLSHCLFCIYNNRELDHYFKQLLKIQKVLKDGKHYIMPQVVADTFVQNIKEFMKGIKIRIVQEMKNCGLLSKVRISRRYSYDDFFLLDNSFNRNLSMNNSGLNEFIGSGIHYMMGEQYEKVRSIARQNMLRRSKANKFKIPHFQYGPEAYKRMFDMIIRYYTKVRDQVVKLEEMWVFLMETVYNQVLKGQMIFEQIHKQLFDSEVLKSQYIVEFLNEIRNSYNIFLQKKKPNSALSKHEDILEKLFQTLQDLEEEISFQYNEPEPECIRKESVETNDQSDPDPIDINANSPEEQQEDGFQMILTYEQLKEKCREKQGGMTLAEAVQMYETSSNGNSHKMILNKINQNKKNAELMNKLPNLDTETICYIIENKITPQDCEKILKESRVKQQCLLDSQGQPYQDYEQDSDDDNYLISPAKEPKLKNNQRDSHNNYSSNEEDKNNEKEIEKKKKKNKKKKRKRKEKKIMAQQQQQLDQIWYDNLQEELERRQMTDQLKQCYHLMNEEEREQLKNFIEETKYSRQALSHRQVLTSSNMNIQGDLKNLKMIMTEENDSEDLPSDKEFEDTLQQFKEKLELISKEATQRKRKLIPNVTKMWLDQLQLELAGQYSFSSPKTGNSLIVQNRELWLSKQQNSA